MVLYVDLYFILNFVLDLLVLGVCCRALGYRKRRRRLLLAAFLGAAYSLVTLSLSFPLAMLLHVLFGALMLLVALGFGNLRRFLRLCMFFYGVSFLLGGTVTALARGISRIRNGNTEQIGLVLVLVCALVGAFVFLFLTNKAAPKNGRVSVYLEGARGNLQFDCYLDTGNQLREPLEGTAVVLVNCHLAKKVFALVSDAPLPPFLLTSQAEWQGLAFRLVPADTVGGRVILPAIKFEKAFYNRQAMPLCIAFDLKRKSDYCGFDGLAPLVLQ